MQYVYTVKHKGQNTGGVLAVTKGLMGKVEGLIEKCPVLYGMVWYGKNAL